MSKKLLLADDSITIQKVIGITFAHEEYQLTVVDNGDAALEKARALKPDLVLADVFMPGKNGYELCAAIKQDPLLRGVPILLLTGTFEPFDEGKAKAAGADSWIAKPFESQALIDRVEGILAQAAKAPAAKPATPPPPIPASVPVPAAAEEIVLEPAFETTPETALGQGGDFGGDLWDDLAAMTENPPSPAVAPPQATEGAEPPADADIWGEVDLGQGASGAVEEIWDEPATEKPAAVAPAPTPIAADAFVTAQEAPGGADAEAFVFEEDPFALTGEDLAPEPSVTPAEEWGGFSEEVLPLEEADIIEEEALEEIAGASQLLMEEDDFAGDGVPGIEISFSEETLSAPAMGETEWEFPEEAPLADFAVSEAPAAAPQPAAEMAAPAAAVPSFGDGAAPAPASAVLEAKVAALPEEEIARIVEKVAGVVIEKLAHTLLERIAWEVVPDLAESLIKDEIRKIKEEVKH